MTKHALNAFLATSISFVNELSDLAEGCGANMRDVVWALRLDRRIGPNAFLNPGLGFAGGTLGRDVQALRRLGSAFGCRTLQLDATLAVNTSRLPHLVQKIRRACGHLRGLRLCLLGLTYKPGTSTLRRSHALQLARMLLEEGVEVHAFDPQIRGAGETEGIHVCASIWEAADRADVVVVVTAWPEFKSLDLTRLRGCVHSPILLDTYNCIDDNAARTAGFQYYGVGMPEIVGAPVLVGRATL